MHWEAAAGSRITLCVSRLLPVHVSHCALEGCCWFTYHTVHLEAAADSHTTLRNRHITLIHISHCTLWEAGSHINTLLHVYISHYALGDCCCCSHITLCNGRLTYHCAQGCCRFTYHTVRLEAAAGSHTTLSATGCCRFTYHTVTGRLLPVHLSHFALAGCCRFTYHTERNRLLQVYHTTRWEAAAAARISYCALAGSRITGARLLPVHISQCDC